MDVTLYPLLSPDFSITRVTTEKGEDLLLYDTLTRTRAYPNTATYNFLTYCRGNRRLREILSTLSSLSGEPANQIQETVSPLIQKMVEKKILFLNSSPLIPPRPGPYEAHLFRRLPSVMVEVTRRCNLHCKHCYNDSGKEREDELTLTEMKALIDALASMGVLNIVFTGGEPLLRPDLFEIISYARRKPLSCMLFTNGTLVTEKTVETLKELGICSVAVSLDGLQVTNDSFRGVPGSFEKTERAVNLFKKAGIPVRLNVCVHKSILDEFSAVLTLFDRWEIDEYSIWPISYTGRDQKGDIFVTPEDYGRAIEELKRYEESKGYKREITIYPQHTNCGIGMSSLTIRSNGTVAPCPSFPEEITLGDVRKDSLIDIWNDSPFLERVRRIDASAYECGKCRYLKACGGGCMADYYRRTGELGCGNPLECAYYGVYRDYPLVEAKRKPRLSIEIR